LHVLFTSFAFVTQENLIFQSGFFCFFDESKARIFGKYRKQKIRYVKESLLSLKSITQGKKIRQTSRLTKRIQDGKNRKKG